MAIETLDREELINTIWLAKGNVTEAARMLHVTSRTIHNYAERYVTVKQAIDDARVIWDNELLDEAEAQLLSQVKQRRAWAIKYALSTKGKQRGYIERQELSHMGEDGGPIEIRMVDYRAGIVDDEDGEDDEE